MNHEEKRKYIEVLFKYVDTESILVIKDWNTLERLRCPFIVKARRDVGLCKAGNYYTVEAVKIDLNSLNDIYLIRGRAYFTFHFTLTEGQII